MPGAVQIDTAKRSMEDSTQLAEQEMSAARSKAIAAVEEESRVWAEAQKVAIRQKKLDQVTQEVGAGMVEGGAEGVLG